MRCSAVRCSVAVAVLGAMCLVPLVAHAGSGELALAAQRDERAVVFEATVALFEDFYWDPGRLDWQAWAARYRPHALSAERRSNFDSVMRRMVREVGDDHSVWLGLGGRSPTTVPLVSPLREDGVAVGPSDDWPREGWPSDRLQAEPTFGIGVVVRWLPDLGAVVVRVLPGSPAEAAGLTRGDVVTSIDGEELGAGGAQIVAALMGSSRGQEPVELRLVRRGREELVVRVTPSLMSGSELERTPSASMIAPTVGYLDLPSFTLPGTGEAVHRLLRDLVDQGARSFVVDLRGNPGGSLSELGVAMGAFLRGPWARAMSRGEVMWTAGFEVGAGGGAAVLRASDGRTVRSVSVEDPFFVAGAQVVALVDEGTSSAAEVAAAVLQAASAAHVVGVTTDGNVEVVRTYPLPDGSRVMVAVANLELPDGRSLDGGIAPDVEARLDVRELARGHDAPVAQALTLLGGLPFVPGRWF